jgi:hypothetical protein
MDGTGEHVKQNKPDLKTSTQHVFSHMWKLDIHTHTYVHIHHKYKCGTLWGGEWEGKGKENPGGG